MNHRNLHAVDEAIAPLETWKADEIPFYHGVLSIDKDGNEEIETVNLADFIGADCKRARDILRIAHREEWDDCDDPQKRDVLIQHITFSCAQGGFNVKCKGWEKKKSRMIFLCQRGSIYGGKVSEVSPSKQRNASTVLATRPEDRCLVRFQIHWCARERRWIIKGGSGNLVHSGHPIKAFADLRLSTKLLPLDEKQLAYDMARVNCAAGAVHAVLQRRTGVDFNKGQIASIMKEFEENDDPTLGEHAGPVSPAQKLVDYLRKTPGLTFVLLTDRRIETDLITVRKQSARERAASQERSAVRSSIQCIVRASSLSSSTTAAASDENDAVSDEFINMATTAQTAAEAYANSIRQSLQLNDNAEILLGVAWTSDEERRRFSMHPEVLAVDVTEQTNKEKRPVVLVASLTPDNETCTLVKGILPSNRKWVFDWLFGTALPELLPERARRRNCILLTDGDRNEYESFEQARPQHFPNSVHRLCSWHLIDRGMKSARLTSSHLPVSGIGAAFFNVAVKWMMTWSSDVESEREFLHSYHLFLEWLSIDNIVKLLEGSAVKLQNFAITKLFAFHSKWVRYHYTYVRCFDRQSSQIVEAENSVLKGSATGTRPSQSIATAAQVMTEQSERRNNRKRKNAAIALGRRPTVSVWSGIEEFCNAYVREQLMIQYKAVRHRLVTRESKNRFLVQSTSMWNVSVDPLHKDIRNFVIPRFVRIRVVTIHGSDHDEASRYVKCTCGKFERFGYPCADIYAVLKREPIPADVSFRYHKRLAYYYGNSTCDPTGSVTKLFDSILEGEDPGPTYSEPEEPFEIGDLETIIRLKAIRDSPTPVIHATNRWYESAVQSDSVALQALPLAFSTAGSVNMEIKLSQAVTEEKSKLLTSSDFPDDCNQDWGSDGDMAVEGSQDVTGLDGTTAQGANTGDGQGFDASTAQRLGIGAGIDMGTYNCAGAAESHSIATSESDSADETDNMKAAWRQGNIFAEQSPTFQEMTKIGIGSYAAYKVITRGMNDLYRKALAAAASEKIANQSTKQKANQIAQQNSIVSSSLPLERCRTATRLGSPNRKRRKRKRKG
jgi:MULE transposase domain